MFYYLKNYHNYNYKKVIYFCFKLCSHQKCRQYIKEKNAYIILRELFNWEKDERASAVCYKLIQVLISDEPEQGLENLHQITVPDELSQKFYEFEQKELEKNFE